MTKHDIPNSTEEHPGHVDLDRRRVVVGGTAGAAAAAVGAYTSTAAADESSPYADPDEGTLPDTGITLDRSRAALVVTDPQVDFFSPDGVTWKVVGDSVEEHDTVANIGRLFAAAKAGDMTVAVSPHYYYPYDHEWDFGGPLEKLMHSIGMFDRESPLKVGGLEGSGATSCRSTRSTSMTAAR